jgi:integrase
VSHIREIIDALEKCSAQIISPKDKLFAPAAQLIREQQAEIVQLRKEATDKGQAIVSLKRELIASRQLFEVDRIGNEWGVVIPPEWDAGKIDKLVEARKATDCRYADPELKLVLMLARFAGLRVPSEIKGMRFSDVEWEADKFYVRSPKTEKHKGGEGRYVPLFQQVRAGLKRPASVKPKCPRAARRAATLSKVYSRVIRRKGGGR